VAFYLNSAAIRGLFLRDQQESRIQLTDRPGA
jgi:hypothetical protein